MHLQKSTSYPSPHVNPRPVGRAYSVNVDRGPLGYLSTKFDRYDVRMHSSGRWKTRRRATPVEWTYGPRRRPRGFELVRERPLGR